MDVFQAFEQVIDRTLQLRPDLLLHTGDLFDTVRPSNRALSFVFDQLRRLSEAGIPVVLLAGNHSTPRLRETGSVFGLFPHLDGVHAIYRGRLETIEVGAAAIHGLPHPIGTTLEAEARRLTPRPDSAYQVAALHGAVVGLEVFGRHEYNEQDIRLEALPQGLDYVALGHYHRFCEVAPRAVYAGSTERFSFAEGGETKGFVEVDLARHRWTFHPLKSRPMLTLEPIDCAGLAPEAIPRAVRERLESAALDGAIVRLRVLNLPAYLRATLDEAAIRRWAAPALHLDLQVEVRPEPGGAAISRAPLGPLGMEFRQYLDSVDLHGLDRAELERRGLGYLQGGEGL